MLVGFFVIFGPFILIALDSDGRKRLDKQIKEEREEIAAQQSVEPVNTSEDNNVKEVKNYALSKWIAIAILIIVFILALSQCERKRGYNNSSGGSWFGKNNSCGKGAWFDKFKDGTGQWRNLDGKFCSK